MTGRRRIAVLLTCGVVALLAAWYAGSRSPAPVPVPAAGSVRLGPDPGEAVDAYLARLPGLLPAPGPPVLAMVQFAAERTAAEAMGAAAGASSVTVVWRVPLPRVQTALRFESLEPGTPTDVAVTNARQRARLAAETEPPPGSPGARGMWRRWRPRRCRLPTAGVCWRWSYGPIGSAWRHWPPVPAWGGAGRPGRSHGPGAGAGPAPARADRSCGSAARRQGRCHPRDPISPPRERSG